MDTKNFIDRWNIKNPERYGVHFGPYENGRFKKTRLVSFWLMVHVVMRVVTCFYRSSRVNIVGGELESRLMAEHKGVLYAHWHRYAQYYFFYAAGKRHVIMSSHKDSGEVGARTMAHVGILTVRGSSRKKKSDGRIKEKGGRDALSAMVDLIRNEGFSAGLTVDGPSGPELRLKPGIVRLARETGAPILVLTAASRPKFRLPTWDRMWMPAPFSRIHFFLSGPFFVPPDADDDEMERIRSIIEEHMRKRAECARLYFSDSHARVALSSVPKTSEKQTI
ncbi:MAG: DUF374 domain-containing protein [Deltaproteobacteria bacterium]|nr:DUF374 domain-containing protein [Candidatus Zymogenaceae bacterium]